MKKIFSISLVLILAIFVISGCNRTPRDDIYSKENQTNGTKDKVDINNNEKQKEDLELKKTKVKVITPAGTPTMSILKMMEEKPMIDKNIDITYESITATDVLSSKIMSGEADIAIIPTNLASRFYNKGVEYKLVATSVWGNLYLVSTEDISSIDQLKGKEIYMIGRGLTPDIIFRYLLKNIGLDPNKDVKLIYVKGVSELAPAFLTGKSTVSIMPEPMLTVVKMKKKNTKVILDFQNEWINTTNKDTSYPQASVFISNKLINNNREFVNKFLAEYKSNIEWINKNPDKAGEYAEALNIGLKKGIVVKSLPGSNIKYMDAQSAKESIEKYLKVLMDFSDKTIGGKLPDENFYLQK